MDLDVQDLRVDRRTSLSIVFGQLVAEVGRTGGIRNEEAIFVRMSEVPLEPSVWGCAGETHVQNQQRRLFSRGLCRW